MRKKSIKRISIALMLALLITLVPADISYAALQSVKAPAKVTTFKSTENFDDEYLRCYVTNDDDKVLKVIYRTPLETSLFRLSLYRVGEDKGDINLNIHVNPAIQYSANGRQTYNFTYYLDMSAYEVPDGKYNIYIRRAATPFDAAASKFSNSGVLNKNMEIQVTSGHVKILRYNDVINYNREIMAIGDNYDTSLYLDNTLEDIRFVLRNPVTNVYATMSYDKISYIKGVSDRITAGVYSNYEKLRKIYEYTASNFYYDSVAFQTHANQYADPYDNIRAFELGQTTVNSEYGKVYTTCQGYDAITIALARAQGIPTRLVYGHRLAVPSNDWITEKNINVRDHWWVEAFVEGRWVFIDPTVGTTNKYDSSTRKWTTMGLTNYTYFDPSEEQIATSHVYMNIYPDYRYGKYLTNEYESMVLGQFLNAYSSVDTDSDDYWVENIFNGTTTNGKLLNRNYVFGDKETWGDGTKSHFMTDGRGNVSQIQWSDKGFTGALNLPGFNSMTLLSSHDNYFESADLSGSKKLQKVYLYGNKLTTVDLSDCPSLTYARVQNNPLKSAGVYVNGKNRYFEAGDNGTFYFTTDSSYRDVISLYSKPDIGYKLGGVYSAITGTKFTDKATWHFAPTTTDYSLRFVLDPASYKQSLRLGDSSESKIPYIQAAAKRLAALGYYQPAAGTSAETAAENVAGTYAGTSTGNAVGTSAGNAVGTETVFDSLLEAATVKFQVVNDIKNSGILAQLTWAALFNENAKPMVSDEEYVEVLANYEAVRAAKDEMAKVSNGVGIKASSSASKGAMKITWAVTQKTTGDSVLDSEISAVLPQDGAVSDYFDGFEVWKSTKKVGGYKRARTTEKLSFKNTSGLTKGTRYYYKVRAYKLIDGKKVYTGWSNITYRKAK